MMYWTFLILEQENWSVVTNSSHIQMGISLRTSSSDDIVEIVHLIFMGYDGRKLERQHNLIVLNWLNKLILCRRFTQSWCSPWWPNVRKHDLERRTWSVDVHWLWADNAASPTNTTWEHFHLIKNTEVNLWEKSPYKHLSGFEREKRRMRQRLWWSHSVIIRSQFILEDYYYPFSRSMAPSGNNTSKSRYMEKEGRKLGSSRYCPLFKSDSMQSEK